MFGDERAEAACTLLYQHWQEGRRLVALPDDLRPATRAEGYEIQARLESRSDLVGWKIAATSAAGQEHIAVDGPLAGRLLSERAHDCGVKLPLGANAMRVAEPEFAFRLGADLPPRKQPYDIEEVMAAVASLHPAIELPDSRFTDFTAVGAPQLIADNACAHEFVLGEATTADWRNLDLSRHVVVGRVERPGGEALILEGSGRNVLGDPRIALTWLVNELSGIGLGLRANQVATTGTSTTPLPIQAGDHVTADFGKIGRCEVRIL